MICSVFTHNVDRFILQLSSVTQVQRNMQAKTGPQKDISERTEEQSENSGCLHHQVRRVFVILNVEIQLHLK